MEVPNVVELPLEQMVEVIACLQGKAHIEKPTVIAHCGTHEKFGRCVVLDHVGNDSGIVIYMGA